MSGPRERILAKLHAAPRISVAAPGARPELLERLTRVDGISALDRLKANLEAAHAEFIACRQNEWRSVLANLCREKQLSRLKAADEIVAMTGGELKQEKGEALSLGRLDATIDEFKQELFDAVDAGITFADCAIVDTGTLILRSAPGQARTLSLVPPVNICLLSGKRLYPTLLAAMAGEKWSAAMPSNLIFVSGPSKTADIQQTLAYGAHGPRELIVIVVTDGDIA